MNAATLLVFGRGVTLGDGGFALTAESVARVLTAVEYVRCRPPAAGPAVVVFSGGWAGASLGAPSPPPGCREGDLMLRAAQAAGLGGLAELRVEGESRSTLENLQYTVRERLLGDDPFTAARPLGLVSHAWHLPRIRYLAGKVLRLRGRSLVDIPATGGDGRTERLLRLGTRLWFAGTRDADALRRRERILVAGLDRAWPGRGGGIRVGTAD